MNDLQDFISFCEAMELLPEEELQTLARGGSNQLADRRAIKVCLNNHSLPLKKRDGGNRFERNVGL